METLEFTNFGFGLEIMDFAGNPYDSPIDAAQWRRCLYEYGVLVFRDLQLSAEQFVAFARQFGQLEFVYPEKHRADDHPNIRLQSNIEGIGAKDVGGYWHSDGPYHSVPTGVTLLQGLETPSFGGETLFIDMRSAFEGLPAEIRRVVEHLEGWYPWKSRFEPKLKALGFDDSNTKTTLDDLFHPLVRIHPVTGRQALYLNERWLACVDGLSESESAVLLEKLYAACTSGAYAYSHVWQPGDVLVWDNAIVMHKALLTAEGERKITRRITTAGPVR